MILEPRFVDKEEGAGIFRLQLAELAVGLAGHEVEEEGTRLVIEDHRFLVFVQDIQAEAHRAFQLAANRYIRPTGPGTRNR